MKSRRILFIAMSGVRVKNATLQQAGLTLPGFVERSRVIASLPSLSLLTLAGYLPENWQPEYVEIDDLNTLNIAKLVSEPYDLVAISSLTARIYDAYRIADEFRLHGRKVVLGGLHVSALPEEALGHADVVVQGEAESLFPEILSDFEKGSLREIYSNMHTSKYSFSEQDPVPRYDLLDPSRYNRLTLQSTRGCPLACRFCAASRMISDFKCKPVPQVRRELEAILSIWPNPFIELADDNTFLNKKWGKELARLICDYPIKWFTETDISVADDDELLELLAKSNCAQLLIGLESSNRSSLADVDPAEWKERQWPSYLAKIEKIQSYGISVNGCFVLGFDEDDTGVFERTRDFVRESKLAEVQITLLTPFPGTELYHQLRAQGRLFKEVYWDQCTLFDLTFHPKCMSPDELEKGFLWLMKEIYMPDIVAERKKIFRQCRKSRLD